VSDREERPAFYALAPGGVRDYWTLLHPPYTLWHLSYVAIGAGLAPAVHVRWLLETLLAFALALGVSAHALVLAYNLELFAGAFHSDAWFAVAWGAFPVLTGYFAQAGRLGPEAVLAAIACAAVSSAQRTLSTPVRRLRRHVERVSGEIELADGSAEPIDAASLRAAPEGALRALSVAMPALAAALLVARWL
jgi:hypothetical protein